MARYAGDTWGDYTLRLRVKILRGRIHLNFRTSGCLRYFIGFDENRIDLQKTQPCGTHRELRSRERYHSVGRWYEVKIVGQGNKIDVSVDGWQVLSFTDPSPLLFGGIALETLENSEFQIDDVTVLGQRPATYGLTWVKTGGPLGGLGYDVRMSPDNPDIIYVTDAWSGVNMSVDGGRKWFASNAGITARTGPSGDGIPVFCLTVDPHDPNVVWIGTQNVRGIFKSTDRGRTWAEKTSGIVEREGISFRGITVHPRDRNTVFAAAELSSFAWTPDRKERIGKEFDLVKGVVYKTTDGGASWTAIWRGDNLARYVLVNPQDPNVIYVSTGIFDREAANSDARANRPGGVGILKSVDGGRSWQALNESNGLQNLYIGSLVMHPTNPDVLLAAAGCHAYRAGSGVYLSTDAGRTWKLVLSGPLPASVFTAVEFSRSNPQVAYAGDGLSVYRSDDGGVTWSRVTPHPQYWGPPGVRAGIPIDIEVDPRDPYRVFVNNYGGGNFLSIDGGRNWTVASTGYTGAQVREVVVAPTDSRLVWAIGRTGPFHSPDGGATWEGLNYDPATNPEWYGLAQDPLNPLILIIADEFQGMLYQSTDGGRTWRHVFSHPQGGQMFPKRLGFKAIAFAPSDPRFVYGGVCHERRSIEEGLADRGYGIYKSTDGGLTWRTCSDGNVESQEINVLVVDPGDHRIVYAGTVKGGVFKTTDGGLSWRSVNRGLQILDIRAMAVDPKNPEILYAGAENGGVYKSSDGGARWQHVSVGMDPQASIRDIVIDPQNPRVIYAADLRTGVYRSNDGAVTWQKLSQGLQTRAVNALAISADGRVLYAATEGEGVFRLDLTQARAGQ